MAVTINGTTGIAVPLGSVSAPGVSNTTSSTTGIYNPTSTTLGVATNGSNAMYIDASQNVGIGTTSPGQRLDLGGGSLMLYNSTGTQQLYLYRASATNYSSIGTDSSAGGVTFTTGTSSPLERMRIDSSGNVNIATTGVSAKLYVNGNAASVISALTDGVTITPDFSLANNFSVTLGGNRTLANPTNLIAGQSGIIYVSQDGTGSRTLAYGSYWKFPSGAAPTLTTTASAVDALVYVVRTSTSITVNSILNIG